MRIAIIGAGAAGLAAGGDLQAAGWQVAIYEKSRGLGGRLATRREGESRFDHGAQYVKADAGRLRALVEASHDDSGAPAYDIGRPVWVFTADGQISAGDPAQNGDPKWCWPSGLSTLAKALGQGLSVTREVEIGSVDRQPTGYQLFDRGGVAVGEADCVLFTAPAPQTAALLAASALDSGLRSALLAELEQASYRRCISLTLAYARRPEVPWYALINSDRAHPISWLACEHDKHGHAPAGQGLITLQMAHSWSVAHFDELAKGSYRAGDVLPEAIASAQVLGETLLGADLGPPLWVNVQRWRYSLPDSYASFDALNGTASGLYFAGDYVAGQGRVHLAIESGGQVAALIVAGR